MGLLREQCAELRKGPLPYCCNQVWMKIGGQISMECKTAICETFKISCLMGRRITKDVLENHLKDHHSVSSSIGWSVTLFLRKTSQESINLAQKSYLIVSWIRVCTRGGIWKGDIMVADIEEVEKWTHLKSVQKRLNEKEVLTPMKW